MKNIVRRLRRRLRAHRLARRYRAFTMVPQAEFIDNLLLVETAAQLPGCVVECGVWRGGMSAGMAEVLGPARHYHLFDSFEGLPEAQPIDGPAARRWQHDKESPEYFNNCAAEMTFAQNAMAMAGAAKVTFHRGWFSDTLPPFRSSGIAVLRCDGDWYASTTEIFRCLYPQVVPGGLIIIDDYYAWDGCAKAVHDYLSAHQLIDRIRHTKAGVCYIVKSRDAEAARSDLRMVK